MSTISSTIGPTCGIVRWRQHRIHDLRCMVGSYVGGIVLAVELRGSAGESSLR